MGLEEKFTKKLVDATQWAKLPTFVPNKKLPVYNWFYYKEGFSRDLVFNVIDMFKVKKNNIVLDPFCGVGTTLLACKEIGIRAIGFDTLPIAVFASRVKTNDYEIEELQNDAKKLLKQKFEKPRESEILNVPKIVKRAFSKYALEDILFFKKKISEINNKKNREFFLLALINASTKVSYARKDGAVLKIEKRDVAPLRMMLRRTIYNMIRDLKNFETHKDLVFVDIGDARRINLENDAVHVVITSPPYLNQIDYAKVYVIENFILGENPKPPIRSFIGFDEENYFKDMEKSISEMYRVCKHKAKLAIIVGNAYIKGIIESDFKIAKIAEDVGFKVKKIYVLNKRYALKRRTIKVGYLRESMIVLEKH